jgi:hypothetical protein
MTDSEIINKQYQVITKLWGMVSTAHAIIMSHELVIAAHNDEKDQLQRDMELARHDLQNLEII